MSQIMPPGFARGKVQPQVYWRKFDFQEIDGKIISPKKSRRNNAVVIYTWEIIAKRLLRKFNPHKVNGEIM